MKKHCFRLQQNRDTSLSQEQKKQGYTTQNLRVEMQQQIVFTRSKYPNIPISRYPDIQISGCPYSGPYSRVCRIRHGGGFLATCTEAINETMPSIYFFATCEVGVAMDRYRNCDDQQMSLASIERQLSSLPPEVNQLREMIAQERVTALSFHAIHFSMAPLNPLTLAWV